MDASTTEYGDYAWTPAGASDRGARQGLPNNAEAEANVLAAMILSPEVVSDAISELRPDDFYRPSHRTLFTAMIEMNERSIPVDSISLIDYLTSEGTLAQVGGEAYILELVGNTIALVNWQHHAGIVRRDSMLREIIGATNQINALAYDAPLDTKEVVERAESMLLSVTEREVSSSYKSLTEFMIEAYNEASEVCAAGGQAHGVPTGFPSLDRLLLGFREGQLIIIGARPAVGKTSFALNLALNAAAAGFTVGFFSLEMSGKEIAQRLICAHAMLSISDFRTGRITPEQWANINEATQELSKLDILIDDTPGTTVTEIRAKARRMLHNKEKAVIILDYLQLVSPPPGRRAGPAGRQTGAHRGGELRPGGIRPAEGGLPHHQWPCAGEDQGRREAGEGGGQALHHRRRPLQGLPEDHGHRRLHPDLQLQPPGPGGAQGL